MNRDHLKQFGSMLGVGIIALAIGSMLKVEASPLAPPPSPSPVVSPSPSPVPVAIASPVSIPSPAKIQVKPSPASPSPVPSPKLPFTWGITLHLLPFPDQNEALIPEQFKLAKELGVDTVRVDYSVANTSLNQRAVAEAKKYDLKIIFIIPFGTIDIFTDPHVKERTTAMIGAIVGEYRNDVHIWQLGNEVASVAIRQNQDLQGIELTDYPEDRYQAVATWLKAAVAAVRRADPSAKTIVTDAYVHVGFFDRFFAEGGDFDILGWDWYSWISDDLNSVPLEGRPGRYRLLSKLKTYKKPIWLTEVSRNKGSYGENEDDRQAEQAAFIESVAKQVLTANTISGFFVYNLIQDQTQPEDLRSFGIVNVDAEKRKIIGVKVAFKRYQALIGKHK